MDSDINAVDSGVSTQSANSLLVQQNQGLRIGVQVETQLKDKADHVRGSHFRKGRQMQAARIEQPSLTQSLGL